LKPLSPRPPVSNATQALYLAAALAALLAAPVAAGGVVAPLPVLGAWDAPGPQAAKMRAAEALSPSNRREIVNCAPPQ
jgi:hypothetical protein